MAHCEKPDGGFLSKITSNFKTGRVDAHVCAACGYTAFWSHSFEKLKHNPDGGAHFIDATPEQGGFR